MSATITNTQQNQQILNQMMQACSQAAQPLLHVAQSGAEAVHEFEFDLATLRDFSDVNICHDPEHEEDFKRLIAIKRPCVYVFEIISDIEPSQVLASAKSYNGVRAMPAFRKTIDTTSKVLYVGKVKRHIMGRVIQHLGFYKVVRTQGLQLFHWASKQDLRLKLTVYEFRPDMIELVPLLENATAQLLKPLVGKHR